MTEQPMWVCHECGMKYGNRHPNYTTCHNGVCGVCGERRIVVEPRDYGYLDMERVKREEPPK